MGILLSRCFQSRQEENIPTVQPVFTTRIERRLYRNKPISELTKHYDTWQI